MAPKRDLKLLRARGDNSSAVEKVYVNSNSWYSSSFHQCRICNFGPLFPRLLGLQGRRLCSRRGSFLSSLLLPLAVARVGPENVVPPAEGASVVAKERHVTKRQNFDKSKPWFTKRRNPGALTGSRGGQHQPRRARCDAVTTGSQSRSVPRSLAKCGRRPRSTA